MSNANASPKSACASTRPMPTKSHVLDSSNASGWRLPEQVPHPDPRPDYRRPSREPEPDEVELAAPLK